MRLRLTGVLPLYFERFAASRFTSIVHMTYSTVLVHRKQMTCTVVVPARSHNGKSYCGTNLIQEISVVRVLHVAVISGIDINRNACIIGSFCMHAAWW